MGCSQRCRAVMAAPAIPWEWWPAPIHCIPGYPLGSQECSVSHCLWRHPSRRKCSPVAEAGHFTLTVPGAQLLAFFGASTWCPSVPQPLRHGDSQVTAAFARGRVLRSLALSNEQQEPTARQLGFIWHSLVVHFCTSCRASV